MQAFNTLVTDKCFDSYLEFYGICLRLKIGDRRIFVAITHMLYCPQFIPKGHQSLKRNSLKKSGVFFRMVFYDTATQYRLYSAGECVVNVRVSGCAEYSGVVPPAPSSSGWILIPHPTGGVWQSSMGLHHSTLLGSEHIVSSPSPQGAITTLRQKYLTSQ